MGSFRYDRKGHDIGIDIPVRHVDMVGSGPIEGQRPLLEGLSRKDIGRTGLDHAIWLGGWLSIRLSGLVIRRDNMNGELGYY